MTSIRLITLLLFAASGPIALAAEQESLPADSEGTPPVSAIIPTGDGFSIVSVEPRTPPDFGTIPLGRSLHLDRRLLTGNLRAAPRNAQ